MSHIDNSIQITHYINPHRFYYKPETAFMQEHEQTKFAVAFNEHCEKKYGTIYETARSTPSWKHPKPGDLVALRSNQLQRWIRCEMEEVMVDINETTWYYLWAIDEGFPIKSLIAYVRPLPQAFGQEPAHAKRGAIINLLPGETEYDYVEDKQILVPSTKWSCGVVSILGLMLDAAESISFFPTTQHVLQNETINVGELFITTHMNATHNVGEKLLEACPNQMIVSRAATYFKGLEYLRAFNKPRYVNNEGLDNHTVNKFVNKISQQYYDTSSYADMDQHMDAVAKIKVSEWLKHSEESSIAMLEQQKFDKDGKEPAIQHQSKPTMNNATSTSVLCKFLDRAKHEVDEKAEKPILMDLTCQTHGKNENAAVLRSKPSNLIQRIKRQQARLQMANTAGDGRSSITSEK